MEENKEKKESKFKQVKRNIFISMTRKASTKEYNEKIKKIREETGEEPDITRKRRMRKQIVEKNAKKMEGKAIISAATVVLIGSIGFGTYALNEGSGRVEGVNKTENGVDIDTKEIDVANQDSVNFRDKYKVILDNEIKSDVTKEVEALETKDQILNYLKEEYVQEYNKTHEEKISIENVSLYRSNNNIVYTDYTTNGEKINIVCSESYAKEHELKQLAGHTGQIITVRIDGKIEETAVGVTDHFEKAYSEREEVYEQNENSILEKIGNVINAGIGYAYAEEDYKIDYKGKLINEMAKYREAKNEETTKEQLSAQKNIEAEKKSNDMEMGE